jgi:hypothetical protein
MINMSIFTSLKSKIRYSFSFSTILILFAVLKIIYPAYNWVSFLGSIATYTTYLMIIDLIYKYAVSVINPILALKYTDIEILKNTRNEIGSEIIRRYNDKPRSKWIINITKEIGKRCRPSKLHNSNQPIDFNKLKISIVDKSINKSVDKSDDKSADKSVDKSDDKSDDKSADKSVDKFANKYVTKTIKNTSMAEIIKSFERANILAHKI